MHKGSRASPDLLLGSVGFRFGRLLPLAFFTLGIGMEEMTVAPILGKRLTALADVVSFRGERKLWQVMRAGLE